MCKTLGAPSSVRVPFEPTFPGSPSLVCRETTDTAAWGVAFIRAADRRIVASASSRKNAANPLRLVTVPPEQMIL